MKDGKSCAWTGGQMSRIIMCFLLLSSFVFTRPCKLQFSSTKRTSNSSFWWNCAIHISKNQQIAPRCSESSCLKVGSIAKTVAFGGICLKAEAKSESEMIINDPSTIASVFLARARDAYADLAFSSCQVNQGTP